MAVPDAEAEAVEDLVADCGPGERAGSVLGNARFDASQYAFFGNDAGEVELGELEEDDDAVATCYDDLQFSYLGDEAEGENECLGSISDVDDLVSTFSKINKVAYEPKRAETVRRGRSFSTEGSSITDWAQEPGFLNWSNQHLLDAEHAQDRKRWSSHPHPSSVHFAESRPLFRTLSSPQQDPLYNPSGPIPMTNSCLPGGSPQASPSKPNTPSSGPQLPLSAPNPSSSFSQFALAGIPRRPFYGSNVPTFGSSRLTNNGHQQNQWSNNGPLLGENPGFIPNLMQQQLPRSNGSIAQQISPPYQHHGLLQVRPLSHFSQLQSKMFSPHHSPPHMGNRFGTVPGMSDMSDLKFRSATYRERQNLRFSQQGFDSGLINMDNGWSRFRSKYMLGAEVEAIVRMQHAATHGNDPYIDDYYHQACLAKKSAGAKLRHHFCPNFIRDPSSPEHPKDEPHAFLQVDALGRLPFSSVRRPRPLLEVESNSAPGECISDQISTIKPLEQEPMLTARITIEDGLCLILDVDDIDRLLQFGQLQDGGSQLKRRRQVLVEELSESFQLVDPLGHSNGGGHSVGPAPKDDLAFLRIVSLPKGRKLISRYLHLIRGSEPARMVCMAICRHMRFIFGSLPLDSSAAETAANLARAVTTCVRCMDHSALSACLAAVVCSSEQPPLRPLGSSAGDGASIIIKTALERATELLSEHIVATNCSMPNRALWQASFDAFFSLLMKYCTGKYDCVVQSLLMQAPNGCNLSSEVSKAISQEMPVDLLRASLPHTNGDQRKVLLDFAQRSMPATAHNAQGAASGSAAQESVPS